MSARQMSKRARFAHRRKQARQRRPKLQPYQQALNMALTSRGAIVRFNAGRRP